MVIRKATAADIESLIQLRLLYLAEHFGDISETKTQICAQLKGYMDDHISRDFIAFLAEEDSGIIACLFLIVQEKPANPRFPNGKTGLILNVFTDKSYRRRGAASNLLGAAIDEAKRLGLSILELTATDAGELLYKKFGFQGKDASKEMLLVVNKP